MEHLDLEIRRHLADYLAGKTPIEEFRRWFVPEAWNVHKRADLGTVDLAHEVDLLLAEFDHGDWTEPELRERLGPLANRTSNQYSPSSPS